MVFLKVVLFVAFACLVTAYPQIKKLNFDKGWVKTATIQSSTNVLNNKMQPIALMNITIGLYNYTSDSRQEVSDTVRRHLANIREKPEEHQESLKIFEGVGGKLPHTFNMTVVEIVSLGPDPIKTVGLTVQVDVYAKKKHRGEILSSMKHLSPAM